MSKIDPAARVEDGAVIGEGTEIGPYCLIGPNVVIGRNCKLIGHATVIGHTSIGDDCVISPFAVLGGAPQDLSYKGEPTRLEVGSGCIIREGVTMKLTSFEADVPTTSPSPYGTVIGLERPATTANSNCLPLSQICQISKDFAQARSR